jgi:uncharacterized repeat protein (TIGR03803 family)
MNQIHQSFSRPSVLRCGQDETLQINRAKQGCLTRVRVFVALCMFAATTASAQTFTVITSFNSTNGRSPEGFLVQGIDGNLYGTTLEGIAGKNHRNLFKVSTGGTLSILYNFCHRSGCPDGAYPNAGLMLAPNGYLYGTTEGGGLNNGGTVFKVSPTGVLTTLYRFSSDGKNGYAPSPLMQATNGHFYGTTMYGGATNGGVIFEITPKAVVSLLHSFDGTDGSVPGGLVQATNGILYGTTQFGGTSNLGTVYEITTAGLLTKLHDFTGTDGAWPSGLLIQAQDGNLYGATLQDGANGGGTIFRISPSGKLTTIYSFCSLYGCYDGNLPSQLIQATDGNFYGTTLHGGVGSYPYNGGTIFKLTPDGQLTTLYSLCSEYICTNDALPITPSALMQATDGNFYGVTRIGGVGGRGEVFSLSTGLKPFVKTVPTNGRGGATVIILGTDFTGAAGVSFNGIAANFTTVSNTEITTTVPVGASTGTVTVTTASGSLFRVTPQITALSPFRGPVGTAVTITGASFTQTRRVTFGGTVATSFTVNSDTELTAILPAGAITGTIRVGTPGGTAVSTTMFTVE